MRVAMLLCVLSVSVSAAGADAKKPVLPCEDADKAFQKRWFADAEAKYKLVQLDNAEGPCAKEGMAKLEENFKAAAAMHARGKTLEATKVPRIEEARGAYVKALNTDSRYADAALALARLGRSDSDDPYLEARILTDLGFEKEAITSLKAAMKSGKEPPADLQYLITDTIADWRRFKRWLLRYRWPIAEMTGVAASLALILGLLWTRLRGSPRIDIRDFSDSAASPKVGRSVTTMLRHYFTQLSTAHKPRIGTFAGPEQAFEALKDITANVPDSFSWLNAVPAVLGRFSPRRTFTVNGDLLPAGDFGRGMTLVLTRGARVIATANLWQNDFQTPKSAGDTDPSGYYILAEPAAVWLLYHVAGEVNA